ncbi:MAG: hypothetical protein M1834_003426 [Cirrosporium novae-zelandiae]|nr:MAG: hypothetical protein M1834_003426 [Cirrosporium novae-zelandiae]
MLSVGESRARGRSKSPSSNRDRSRSRDGRSKSSHHSLKASEKPHTHRRKHHDRYGGRDDDEHHGGHSLPSSPRFEYTSARGIEQHPRPSQPTVPYTEPVEHRKTTNHSDNRQPTYSQSSADDWAPIPACELPGYAPPLRSYETPSTQYASMPTSSYAPPASTSADVNGTIVNSLNSSSTPDHAKFGRYDYLHPATQLAYATESKPSYDQPSYVRSPDSHYPGYKIAPSGNSTELPPSPRLGMQRLSVAGTGPVNLDVSTVHSQAGVRPPGSPLLEPYLGTYQSISPMPSPMMLSVSHHNDSDLSDFEPLSPAISSTSSHEHGRSEKRQHAVKPSKSKAPKRVSFYDPNPDAKAIARALARHKPDLGPLVSILPRLSSEDMLDLRIEYKNQVKISGHGINIAKHIKMQIPGKIGIVTYATALGRWESEAHWANFWYQSNSSRRELLIESLMGRPNSEIRAIKNAFSDKRYGDSLERCMKAELRADKFRMAILLALEETRMSEDARLDLGLVDSDGETLTHIINGALSRPLRDAMLLHQSLSESSKDANRTELLVSRLVRYHWEPRHMERVKSEYRERYGAKLEHDIEDIFGKGDFKEFCLGLASVGR